jgi:hypothetical protein
MYFRQRCAVRKVPQIANPQFADLNLFLDLRTFRKYSHLRICDLRTMYFWQFADLRFVDPIIFCGLKTSANNYFFPYNYKLEPLLLEFKDDFWRFVV